MDLPIPNIPLLRKAVEWAEAEAAKTDGTGLWNQSWYITPTACGTAYCIAGYVAAIQPTFEPLSTFEASIEGAGDDLYSHGVRLLGLADDEAPSLFAAHNTIADVRRIAEQIAARAGERL